MFALCLESSHEKGMGHLFRMVNFADYLLKQKQDVLFLLNDNEAAINLLKKRNFAFETIPLDDVKRHWERTVIEKYNIRYWINDRLETDSKHALNVKEQNCQLITFDDRGSGAEFSDINICGLFFQQKEIKGKEVLKGLDFLILNPEIDHYKRERNSLKHILVSLGGSDTHGITLKILTMLKKRGIKATIHTGPSFGHQNELAEALDAGYRTIRNVPSLISEFAHYDLAITGGGMTPFEANASGLPCLIVANETFEVANGKFLHALGSSCFLGHHSDINEAQLDRLNELDLHAMSVSGMQNIQTKAIENIYHAITRF